MKYYKFLIHGVQNTHFKKNGRVFEYTDWFSSEAKARAELEQLKKVFADRMTSDYGDSAHFKPNKDSEEDTDFVARKLVTQRVK